MGKKYELNKRNSIFAPLKEFDPGFSGENGFIEVTEWTNGEGWDIEISSKGRNERIQLTWGEFEGIKKLIKELDKQINQEYKKNKKI